jgi:hypothetical protein
MILRVILYCLLGGVAFISPAMGAGHAFWWWTSGVVMAAAFVPVALFGPKTALGQFGVIFPVLLLVSVVTMWSEALLFIKSPAIQEHWVRNVTSDTVSHLIAAIALVILWRVLKLTHPSTEPALRSPLAKAAAMVAFCGIAYLVYYLVFGGLTYQLFTKRYYPDAIAAVVGLGNWFWGIQFVRGLLMTLAIVPAIYTLRLGRWQTAICAGLLLWVAGGLSLLLAPNELMTSTQRFIHIIEIFTQAFTLGVTAGLLLRPKRLVMT